MAQMPSLVLCKLMTKRRIVNIKEKCIQLKGIIINLVYQYNNLYSIRYR